MTQNAMAKVFWQSPVTLFPMSLIGTQYQQDVHLTKPSMDVAVYNERVMGPAHVHNVVDEAVRTELRAAVYGFRAFQRMRKIGMALKSPRSKANIKCIAATKLLRAMMLLSEPPNRVKRRHHQQRQESRHLAGAVRLVVAAKYCSWRKVRPRGQGAFGQGRATGRQPVYHWRAGLAGTAPSQEVMAGCDRLVIIGSGFPYMKFYPKPGQGKCVQIDIDPRIGSTLSGRCRPRGRLQSSSAIAAAAG